MIRILGWTFLLLLAGPARAEEVPGELLVRFKPLPAGRLAAKDDPWSQLHARLGSKLEKRLPQIRLDLVRYDASLSLSQAAAAYGADPLVLSTEPNLVWKKSSPGDALYTAGLQAWYDRINATAAFNAGAAALGLNADLSLAVLDTGVAPHPDFPAGVLQAQADFVTREPSASDLEGHGTFVSGLIAASATASPAVGAGLAGVFFHAPRLRLQSVRVLDSQGRGYTTEIAEGLVWAADRGIRVVNMSLGQEIRSDAMEDAVNYARGKGVFMAVAAGNNEGDTAYPAAYSACFSVSALGPADSKAYYSSFGKVELSAPGGEGLASSGCTGGPSGYTREIWSFCQSGASYAAGAGTSFAAPMVAAAAALLLSQDPGRGVGDLHRILTQSASPTLEGPGWHKETGWGKLNVYGALTYSKASSSGYSQGLRIYNWPNPFRAGKEPLTNLTFFLPAPAEAQLILRDLGGDPVFERKLSAAETAKGMNLVAWDGLNQSGRPCASGTYLLIVSSGGSSAVNRLLLLR